MRIYEKKEVPVIKEVLIKTICNICENEIINNCAYYEVTTGHNDWGNDSVESIEEKHICSDECLRKEFEAYLECDDDTKYINIRRKLR